MSEFYNDLNKWYKGDVTHIIHGCNTSVEFNDCKLDVLKLLGAHPDGDVEATFTMYKIEVRHQGRRCIIDKLEAPKNSSPADKIKFLRERTATIRGRRADFGILDEYPRSFSENEIDHLVEAVNNARTHSPN